MRQSRRVLQAIQRRDRDLPTTLAALPPLSLPVSIAEWEELLPSVGARLTDALERYALPLFMRDAATAAAVVLRAAVGPTHPTGRAAELGVHYFNGMGEAVGDASLTLRDEARLERLSGRRGEGGRGGGGARGRVAGQRG